MAVKLTLTEEQANIAAYALRLAYNARQADASKRRSEGRDSHLATEQTHRIGEVLDLLMYAPSDAA